MVYKEGARAAPEKGSWGDNNIAKNLPRAGAIYFPKRAERKVLRRGRKK